MEKHIYDFQSTEFFYFNGSPPKFAADIKVIEVPSGFTVAEELFRHNLVSLGCSKPFVDYYSIDLIWQQIDDLYLQSCVRELEGRFAFIHDDFPQLRDEVLGDEYVRGRYINWCYSQIMQNDEEDCDPLTPRFVMGFPESSRDEIVRLWTMPRS